MKFSHHKYANPLACALLLGAGALTTTAQDLSTISARPPIHLFGPFISGYTPQQITAGYGFSQISNKGAGQTIAIVDAFDDPNAESDLGVFTTQWGLPACTTANGCFKKVYASGSQPTGDTGWGLEISLDVQWAHTIAPQAKILLVEAATNSYADLFTAIDAAVANGASVVSMSWGGGESNQELTYDSHFSAAHVTFVASSGDNGHGVEYPAASPYVVGVGGTHLVLTTNGTYTNESAWSGSGGGISAFEPKPSFQKGILPLALYTSKTRGVPDVSYNGDPNTGVPVYDTYGQNGWIQVGGTSAGAPQWAALFAIVNSLRTGAGKSLLNAQGMLPSIYSKAFDPDMHDVTGGTNGVCGKQCNAGRQYDFVTGEGTPVANNLIPALAALP